MGDGCGRWEGVERRVKCTSPQANLQVFLKQQSNIKYSTFDAVHVGGSHSTGEG